MNRSQKDLLDSRICSECAADPSISAQTVCPHSPLLTDDPLLGTTINERYQILSVVGVGGWSTVYRADDKKLNRAVAIKLLHLHLCIDQEKLQRFGREAHAASALSHQNIAVIHDTGMLPGGRPFIVMEVVEGKSLAQIIPEGRPLRELIYIFHQVCEGLLAIHESGLVHRDLKPSNIVISNSGVAKVLDFGSAKWILQDDLLTRTTESIGTPSYMSPEQCTGGKIDCRSDIYSLGCIMYEVMTGLKAFPGESSLVCMQNQIQAMPPSFQRVRPELKTPPGLEMLIFKALAKDPRDRFAAIGELQKALDNYQTRPNALQRALHMMALKQISRHDPRLPMLGYCLVALLVLAGAGILLKPFIFKERTLNFPPGHAVGTLYAVTHTDNGKDLRTRIAVAQGAVSVPEHAEISLNEVPDKDAVTLSVLSALKPTDLYALDVAGAAITPTGIDQINKLSGLTVLSLHHSEVSDEALARLNLPVLKGLDLSDTKQVSDEGLAHFATSLSNLNWVSLNGNSKVTDRGISELAKLKQVHHLRLDDMPALTDRCAEELSNSRSISSLVFGSDKITDAALSFFSRTKDLHSLDLSGTLVTDAGMKYLLPLKNLHNLNLSGTHITDAAVDDLSQMTSLQHLNVSSTAISEPTLKQLKAKLPQCTFDTD